MTFLTGVAFAALTLPGAAYAQSTGSVDFDNEIVVTGERVGDVGGVQVPETTKAKAVLTQEFIKRQVPGQTVDDIINMLPGVSFQNNDPFGSAGGTLTIRGFDNSRISQTFDGVPLNDSGNYALYSNQQLDPELIEQVNVNLGSTDVDSPTAAASGSTVNYRTRNPFDEFGARLQGSVGDYSFFRIFGAVDTGVFTPWGTKAFFSASHAENDNVFNDHGKIDKQQYNAKVYQPLGDNGDFISIAGHYNENRNNFFGSVGLRNDRAVTGGFPQTKDERFYEVGRCQIDTPEPGVADAPNSCGTSFDYRFNPSNTGNIRVNSRFTLADGLVLTVDPSYQYVKANGGGTTTGYEYSRDVDGTPLFGYIGGKPYTGVDLNGDGDLLDAVTILQPSQTQTHRYGVIASLRYDLSDTQSVRVAYSYDRARHRQTGRIGLLQANGNPFDVFPINDPVIAADGFAPSKRDRLSYATLHQVSGEYRGSFFADALMINAGVRAPFFKRDLSNYCFTTSASGFVDCFGRDNDAANAAYAAANAGVQGPQQRVLKYDKVLPNVGFTYNFTPVVSMFANYSKGLQVPGTDNLYNSFFFAPNSDAAHPNPETTDNFDLGVRYTSSKVQAQVSGWYTIFNNRLASAYDPVTDRTIYRNLGRVDKYGIDGSIAYAPIPEVQLYVFGSYMKSKIKDNVLVDTDTSGNPIYAMTAGKRESGAPVYTMGGRASGQLGPLELGVQAKRTGPRYVNDQNLPITIGGAQVYGAKVPAYTLVDLDARLPLDWAGLNDKTFLQLNLSNVFDELYVGGFSGGLPADNAPFVQIGSPRTFIATINFQI
nr:TonB-dependent receptor [Hephaestia caeni]